MDNLFFDCMFKKLMKQNKTLVLLIDHYPIIHEAIVDGKIDFHFADILNEYLQNNDVMV